MHPSNGPKLPYAARFINSMIRIALIPVHKTKNGDWEFKYFSCKFFFCVVIWIVIQLSVTAMCLQFTRTRDNGGNDTQVSAARENSSNGTYLAQVLGQILDESQKLFTISIPICLGILVQSVKLMEMQDLVGPSRRLQIFLMTALGVLQMGLMMIDGNLDFSWASILFKLGFVYAYLVSFYILLLAILVVNIYGSSFVVLCKRLNMCQDKPDLIRASRRLIYIYRSLRTGLSPLLFWIFTVSVFLIICSIYMILIGRSYGPSNSYLTIPFIQMLLIFNLSSVAQECYDEFYDSRNLIR